MGSTARRRITWALAAVVGGGTLAGCTDPGPTPSEVATRYAHGVARLDLSGVPLDGADAATTTTGLRGLVSPLGQVRPTVTVVDGGKPDGESTTARLRVAWPLGDGSKPWTYETTVPMVKKDGGWKATWTPASVVPGAVAGDTLVTTRKQPPRATILGAGHTPLVVPRPVVRLGVDKASVTPAQALAAAPKVAAFAGLSDVAGYTRRVQDAGPKAFVEAIVVRRDDPMLARLDSLAGPTPGVGVVADELPLAPTRTFARPILGSVGEATAEIVAASEGQVAAGDTVGLAGLQRSQDAKLRGLAGVTVSLKHGGTTRKLWSTPPAEGREVLTTLDVPRQTRAEQLLASVGPASAIVAVRPSDGDVLVAASGPGGQGMSTATLGTYAPGSTFKIVTALGLLRAGVTPAQQVPCTPTVTVAGKAFENYDSYPADGLGSVPLATAFAKSCNTAFIGLRDKVAGDVLPHAAEALGLTAKPSLGVPGYLGAVPAPTGPADLAAETIGQGEITASPLGMATVVASVVAGRPVAPRIVIPDKADRLPESPVTPRAPVTPAESATLRTLMRGVVTDGSGDLLKGLPGEVVAKTGTAEFGTTVPPKKHAWMVAARGDLAVAVFVDEGEGGSRTAGPILKAFLAGER